MRFFCSAIVLALSFCSASATASLSTNASVEKRGGVANLRAGMRRLVVQEDQTNSFGFLTDPFFYAALTDTELSTTVFDTEMSLDTKLFHVDMSMGLDAALELNMSM